MWVAWFNACEVSPDILENYLDTSSVDVFGDKEDCEDELGCDDIHNLSIVWPEALKHNGHSVGQVPLGFVDLDRSCQLLSIGRNCIWQ